MEDEAAKGPEEATMRVDAKVRRSAGNRHDRRAAASKARQAKAAARAKERRKGKAT